ncbi:MAG TPA: hypothetical protein VLL77_14150 [Anaerolineales bacterium]|nr:hypothetical protein [Anaerolineales bacterium]
MDGSKRKGLSLKHLAGLAGSGILCLLVECGGEFFFELLGEWAWVPIVGVLVFLMLSAFARWWKKREERYEAPQAGSVEGWILQYWYVWLGLAVMLSGLILFLRAR